jgi:hypothetical protein
MQQQVTATTRDVHGAPARGPAPPLLIADGDIPTTHIIARVLRAAAGDVEIRYPATLFGTDASRRTVAFSRVCTPTLAWLPRYLAKRGIGYLYCLDDDFWSLDADVDPHLAAFFANPATIATLEAFMRGSRAAVVMSARLGAAIETRLPGTRVEWLNPPFDTERADELLRAFPAPASDRPVRIAYPTSRRPAVAALLNDVVRHLVQRYKGRVEFEFVGWMPDALAGVSGVTLLPHVSDYDRYLELAVSRRWDIGLAPLVGSAFDACKTSVKYREYGGCRVAGVYAAVPPYTDDVVDGRTGVLVQHRADAWIDALERLIDSPARRGAIADAAHADVATRFSQRASVQRWREIARLHGNA